MASAELLKMTHIVDGKVMGVDDRVKGVERKMQVVCDDVQGVGNKVQDVEDIGKDISNRVQGVDDKLDQANRSSLTPFSSVRRLKQHRREPAQRQRSTMAIAPRSIHQS